MSWARGAESDHEDNYNAANMDDDGGGGDGDGGMADELVGMMIGMGSLATDAEKLQAFQSVCGFDEAQARFYLDASSWNLDMAVSAFFAATAEQAAQLEEFHATVLGTSAESHNVGRGEPFTHEWQLRNTGLQAWPTGSYLNLIDGHAMSGQVVVLDRDVAPNEDITVSLQLAAPTDLLGHVFGIWRLHLPTQEPFGEPMRVGLFTSAPWGGVGR